MHRRISRQFASLKAPKVIFPRKRLRVTTDKRIRATRRTERGRMHAIIVTAELPAANSSNASGVIERYYKFGRATWPLYFLATTVRRCTRRARLTVKFSSREAFPSRYIERHLLSPALLFVCGRHYQFSSNYSNFWPRHVR